MSGQETILLVEDELSLLNLSKKLLEMLGYNVLAADSPGAALLLAKEHSLGLRLLMTDVVMPGMSGRELAENLHAYNPKIKCLYMSGYTATVMAQHGVIKENVNFIQKPFSLQGLATKVRELLDSEMN